MVAFLLWYLLQHTQQPKTSCDSPYCSYELLYKWRSTAHLHKPKTCANHKLRMQSQDNGGVIRTVNLWER